MISLVESLHKCVDMLTICLSVYIHMSVCTCGCVYCDQYPFMSVCMVEHLHTHLYVHASIIYRLLLSLDRLLLSLDRLLLVGQVAALIRQVAVLIRQVATL